MDMMNDLLNSTNETMHMDTIDNDQLWNNYKIMVWLIQSGWINGQIQWHSVYEKE